MVRTLPIHSDHYLLYPEAYIQKINPRSPPHYTIPPYGIRWEKTTIPLHTPPNAGDTSRYSNNKFLLPIRIRLSTNSLPQKVERGPHALTPSTDTSPPR